MTTAPQRLFIGGEWTEPDHGHYEVINPATEQAVGLAPEASRRQVYAAAAEPRVSSTLGQWGADEGRRGALR
ncbi:aldehyde dehydrogenase, partial [Streptomyces sp. NPDC002922]